MMPATKSTYPTRDEIIQYLLDYEKRYAFEIQRSTSVLDVSYDSDFFQIKTTNGDYSSRAIISATGNWTGPFIPKYVGVENFKGIQLHSAFYEDNKAFSRKRVLIVGAGNSAAQILAEVSLVGETIWVTLDLPEFLPDEVDGSYLFQLATRKYQAMLKGEVIEEAYNLGKIVMVDSVKDARKRGVLKSKTPFNEIKENSISWNDGSEEKVDVIIWCTGFKTKLTHLKSLYAFNDQGRIDTKDSHSLKYPGLWLVGYGDWTGFASATLVGVQRTAKQTSLEVKQFLDLKKINTAKE